MAKKASSIRSRDSNKLIAALTSLSESELTHDVLIPLLRTLGYQDVEYTGGPTEKGKDIICWGVDELGNTTLAVAQVKKYKPSARAADSRSFSEIVTQLSQASEEPIPRLEGQLYRPSCVYFFTPFPIDLRALQTRIERVKDLYSRNLKIVDGKKIATLLRRQLPSVVTNLCGPQSQIHDAIVPQLSNDVLMKALRCRTGRKLNESYTDIDLSPGRATTQLLGYSSFKGSLVTARVKASEWAGLCAVLERLRTVLGIDLVAKVNKRAQTRFEREIERWRSLILSQRELSVHHCHAAANAATAYDTLIAFKNRLSQVGIDLAQFCRPIEMSSSRRDEGPSAARRSAIQKIQMRVSMLHRIASHRVDSAGSTLSSVVKRWVGAAVKENTTKQTEERRTAYILRDALAEFRRPLADKDVDLAWLLEPINSVLAGHEKALHVAWARALEMTQARLSRTRGASSLRGEPGGDTLGMTIERWTSAVRREKTPREERRQLALSEDSLASLYPLFSDAGINLGWLREPIDHIRAAVRRVPSAAWDSASKETLRRLEMLQKAVDMRADPNGPTLSNSMNWWISAVDEEEKSRVEQRKLSALEEPELDIALDGSGLATYLQKQRKWLSASIQRINSRKAASGKALKSFFDSCEVLFRLSEQVFGDPHVCRSIGISERMKYNMDPGKLRLTIPINQVFATGRNLALLGGAGAGKTTALQKYALDCYGQPDSETLLLFVPLGRIAEPTAQPSNTDCSGSAGGELEERIAAYISSLGTPVSASSLRYELRDRRATLLLDGVDEAIGMYPELPDAIAELAMNYPRMQIIASSRTSSDYASEIPFLGITLLPFTAAQRESFIGSWFGKTHNRPAVRIINHLKKRPELAENVRNPLLATILCVLAESGIPLPTSEVRLYEERLHLLLGHYDIAKGVQRISSSHHDLEVVARKLAFCLHTKEAREADLGELVEFATSSTVGRILPSECERAVNELVDPCNVLVPMTATGELGFGHLRYQEHLVAMELAFNRGIALPPLLARPFWNGAFVVYAQRADSIDEIVAGTRSLGGVAYARNVVEEMISVRPEHEREHLGEILRSDSSAEADSLHFLHEGVYQYAAGLDDLDTEIAWENDAELE